jgi:ADP-ribosylglycohydrolase
MKVSKEYFRGCLLGGATADAKAYGMKHDGKDLISDNTQLASFTLDGLVWAHERAVRRGVYAYIPCLFYSYQKWYYTQTRNLADKNYSFILSGEILDWEDLFARRGTGITSLTALAGSIENKYGTLKNHINNSRGCGSLVRVAPIGLYFWRFPENAFRIGAESSALTHGHTDAILSSGFYAAFVANIVAGRTMRESAEEALDILETQEGHENSSMIIRRSLALVDENTSLNKAASEIGEGLAAPEAAALAIYICLKYMDDFDGAILAAMTFKGNNASVAPIVGNALGTFYGVSAIPQRWMNEVELADLMIHGADLLFEKVDMEDV